MLSGPAIDVRYELRPKKQASKSTMQQTEYVLCKVRAEVNDAVELEHSR